jgi:hypothetical protein
MPMLTDAEAAYVLEPMDDDWVHFERLRRETLDRYWEVTGFDECNINAVWHHVASLYGPPCRFCLRPLRTPRAKFCASCGASALSS